MEYLYTHSLTSRFFLPIGPFHLGTADMTAANVCIILNSTDIRLSLLLFLYWGTCWVFLVPYSHEMLQWTLFYLPSFYWPWLTILFCSWRGSLSCHHSPRCHQLYKETRSGVLRICWNRPYWWRGEWSWI